jgi:hypothetical protein
MSFNTPSVGKIVDIFYHRNSSSNKPVGIGAFSTQSSRDYIPLEISLFEDDSSNSIPRKVVEEGRLSARLESFKHQVEVEEESRMSGGVKRPKLESVQQLHQSASTGIGHQTTKSTYYPTTWSDAISRRLGDGGTGAGKGSVGDTSSTKSYSTLLERAGLGYS